MEGYRRGLYPDFMMREQTESIETDRGAVRGRPGELGTRLSRLEGASSYSGQAETFARRISVGLDGMDF